MRLPAALFQEARTLGSGGYWDSLGASRWVEGCGESLELRGPSLVRARPPTQVQAWGQSPQAGPGSSAGSWDPPDLSSLVGRL